MNLQSVFFVIRNFKETKQNRKYYDVLLWGKEISDQSPYPF